MIKSGKIILGLALLVSLALALSYCGSKSSDSGTTGTASAGAGSSASTGAIRSATIGLSATASSSSAPSLGKARNLSEAVNGLYDGLRADRAEESALTSKYMVAAAPYSAPSMTSGCLNGGAMATSISTAGTTTTMTITYTNCTEKFMGTLSLVQNGTVTTVDRGLSFTRSWGNSTTPYTVKLTRLSDSKVLEEAVKTMTISGAADPSSKITCGTGKRQIAEYTKITIDMDGSMSVKGTDGAGAAYDETFDAAAYKLVTSNTLDSACTATSGTITQSGKFSYTDNLGSTGTESLDISVADPLSLTWTRVTTGTTGVSYTLNGTVSMATSCFTGAFSLATTQNIFYPTNADCPTAGTLVVWGDVNGSVVYTAAGGVTIKDQAGAVVETYASCKEAQACQ